ncbi:uncharacterized protein LOC114535005 [Dendronephthya gigantea]|uniref:uncharacterized protein LOC114535005 n=1 Tax=Dendronephthya gigantea TaxID=151771 RepID=UPI00106CC38A|nr:uncharacterized protein LOC114535005 [Dendronephthya gigantea]
MASDELQEKANFARLSRLLVEKGTEALRNTFDTIHPPVSLPRVLATNKTSLQKLKPRIINNSQWDLLFPPSGNPPDSKTFNITLLTVLFRNICGFPSTGWGVMPPDCDRSTQANITRIKFYRNKVIAQVTTTRVDNSTFQSLWKKIGQALVELGVSQSDVDDLEKCPLEPKKLECSSNSQREYDEKNVTSCNVMAFYELQEKANFARLSRLLVDKGTEALRNTFDTIHPPVSLPGVLAANKTSLQKLKPRIINNSQWDLLFPPSGNPPDSKTFNITLLTVLIRNICGFPSTGWSVMPPDWDRSTQANITRIKCYRNEVIAQVTTTRVDNSTFQSLWKKIGQALVELGTPQSDVDDLEKCPLEPEKLECSSDSQREYDEKNVTSCNAMASDELQEKANFTRLSRLLVAKGTEALRNKFDTIHPPVSLPRVLAANKTSLQKLKPRVINNSQWDLLFPPSGNPPDSKTFDVTLLTVLFRNICGFPSTVWDLMPPDWDKSTQANITRIKCYRNNIYAHVTTTRVDNSTFESLWKKISQVIVELGVSQSDVDDLEKCSLGPEEEVYVQKLKDWKLHKDECIKMLATMTQIAEENRDEINKTCHSSTKRKLSIPGDSNPEKKSRMESD